MKFSKSWQLSLLNASFLRKNNKPFLLENASNLTHEFLYDNFNKKILLNFLVKIVITKLMCKFDAFSRKRVNFSLKKRGSRNESVKLKNGS